MPTIMSYASLLATAASCIVILYVCVLCVDALRVNVAGVGESLFWFIAALAAMVTLITAADVPPQAAVMLALVARVLFKLRKRLLLGLAS